MGKQLVGFYEKATVIGGVKAKMRLAMLTAVSSLVADETPDTPENVAKFENAMKEIEKEFRK